MSLVRINEFEAHRDTAEALREALTQLIPALRAAPGCLSCRLLEDESRPTHFVILDEWATREAHAAAIANLPRDALRRVMTLVKEVPAGAFYDVLA